MSFLPQKAGTTLTGSVRLPVKPLSHSPGFRTLASILIMCVIGRAYLQPCPPLTTPFPAGTDHWSCALIILLRLFVLTTNDNCIVTTEPGGYRDGSTVKRLGALAEDLGSFPEPTCHLAATCHSSSRDSNAPFWPLVLPRCLPAHTSTCIYINMINKKPYWIRHVIAV